MGSAEIIAAILIVLIVGASVFYIVKQKKRGKGCIGCPYAGTCGKQNDCDCAENKKQSP